MRRASADAGSRQLGAKGCRQKRQPLCPRPIHHSEGESKTDRGKAGQREGKDRRHLAEVVRDDEPDVGRPLGQASHEVRIPLRPVGDVDTHRVAFGG